MEKILSVYESLLGHQNCWREVTNMLHMYTYVGGSTTLITRCGILSWIEYRMAMAGPDQFVLARLKVRIWESCDRDRVEDWLNGKRVDRGLTSPNKVNDE